MTDRATDPASVAVSPARLSWASGGNQRLRSRRRRGYRSSVIDHRITSSQRLLDPESRWTRNPGSASRGRHRSTRVRGKGAWFSVSASSLWA